MGDFLGFTFGDIHSSNLGITRVSGGDRYEEQLHPEIKDRTVEVPGLNGEYYFGSDFGTRTFDIEIAFDHLTEEQFRKLRQVFGTKDIKRLIFDERPYKYYMAKLESPIELSYICFDEPNYTWQKEQTGYNTYMQGISGDYEHKVYDGTVRRIYKGEGKISFISYFPFAKSVFKVLPTDQEESDWVISSGILSEDERVNIDVYNNNSIIVYNPGDIATGFRLYIPGTVNNNTHIVTINAMTITYGSDDALELEQITWDNRENSDVGILIDTNNQLILGVSTEPTEDFNGNWTYTTSGNLYNQHILSGHFFHLQPNVINDRDSIQIVGGVNGIKIFYDYLYF